MEKLTVYVKENNKYIETYATTDIETIYRRLTEELIAKKINSCKWIQSIKRNNLYNGYQKITVHETNGIKAEYIIKG